MGPVVEHRVRLAAQRTAGALGAALLGTVVALGVAAGLAPAADASGPTNPVLLPGQPLPTVHLSSPAPTAGSASPPTATVTTPLVAISGTVAPGDQGGTGTIQSPVSVSIVSSDGHPGINFTLPVQPPGPGGGPWTFSGSPPAGLAWNGSYQLSVAANENDRDALGVRSSGRGSVVTSFGLAVPPIPPQNVTATSHTGPGAGASVGAQAAAPAVSAAAPNGTNTTTKPPTTPTTVAPVGSPQVQISWSANPEPDMIGYQVLRSEDASGFDVLATTAKPGFTDTSVALGHSYSYEVVAERQGVAADQTVLSAPAVTSQLAVSAASSATVSAPNLSLPTSLSSPAPAPVAVPLPSASGSPSGSSPAPVTGAPTYGGFQSVLPYGNLPAPKVPAVSSPATTSPPASGQQSALAEPGTIGGKASSPTPLSPASRARTFAVVALGMVLLAAAAHLRRLFKVVSQVPSGQGG